VPEPLVMLVALRAHTRLVELVETASATVPANPFKGATVIVETAVAPALTFTLIGLALTVKSCTWKTTVAE
jgi:hypothetical protein